MRDYAATLTGKILVNENLTIGDTISKLSGKATTKFLSMHKGYSFNASILNPAAIIAPNIDINKTIPITIQDEIASIILTCLVSLLGFTILKAIGFASFPTINISNKSATINPSQKSFNKLFNKLE